MATVKKTCKNTKGFCLDIGTRYFPISNQWPSELLLEANAWVTNDRGILKATKSRCSAIR